MNLLLRMIRINLPHTIFLLLLLAGLMFSQDNSKEQNIKVESDIPNILSYEGYISDASGQQLADGQHDFTFAIYTKSVGGSPIWKEVHNAVSVKNGFIQLYLGRGTPPKPLNILFDQPYYLGVSVDGNSEMMPRLELTPTGYSFRAKIADEVPDGSITTEKLAPLSVSNDKIKDISWDKITDIPNQVLSLQKNKLQTPTPASGTEEILGPGGVPANVWHLFGNSNSDSTQDMLGTSDFQALVMKTNNMERLRIKATGEINIDSDLKVGHDLEVGNNASIGNNLDVFGITTLHNTTESTTTGNGALIVAGGVGIARRINVGGNGYFESDLDVDGITRLNNPTESTTTTDGALIVNGGAGIGKRLNLGSDLNVAGNSFLDGRVGIGAVSPSTLKLYVRGQGSFAGNHIALFENTGSTSPDGIAIKVSAGTPNNQNNFITFLDGNNDVRGRIEGQTAADVVTSPEYIFFTALDAFELGLAVADVSAAASSSNVCAGAGAVACPPIPSLIAGAAAKLAAQAGRTAATQAFLFDNLGVSYQSGNGDYAEYLERIRPGEEIEAGDIVGVFGGKITKTTKGAQQIMSVSMAPIILGNLPSQDNEQLYEKVAFMGQVPVKVVGIVNSGDYIIPSGREDGTGIAVSPEMMTVDEFAKVVGRAWSSSDNELPKLVNVIVGLNSRDLTGLIKKQQLETQSLRAQMETMKTELAGLKKMENKVAQLQMTLEDVLSNADRRYATKQQSN